MIERMDEWTNEREHKNWFFLSVIVHIAYSKLSDSLLHSHKKWSEYKTTANAQRIENIYISKWKKKQKADCTEW